MQEMSTLSSHKTVKEMIFSTTFQYKFTQTTYEKRHYLHAKELLSLLKKTSGEGWEIPSWENGDTSDKEEAEVRWVIFTSTTGHTRPMAIHPHFDYVSGSINKKHCWEDCDALPSLWNKSQSKSNLYVEIGANIGSCVTKMLLSTNVSIVAFEPHPMNLLCLKETISKLEPELQNRIVLVPTALGENQDKSTI